MTTVRRRKVLTGLRIEPTTIGGLPREQHIASPPVERHEQLDEELAGGEGRRGEHSCERGERTLPGGLLGAPCGTPVNLLESRGEDVREPIVCVNVSIGCGQHRTAMIPPSRPDPRHAPKRGGKAELPRFRGAANTEGQGHFPSVASQGLHLKPGRFLAARRSNLGPPAELRQPVALGVRRDPEVPVPGVAVQADPRVDDRRVCQRWAVLG